MIWVHWINNLDLEKGGGGGVEHQFVKKQSLELKESNLPGIQSVVHGFHHHVDADHCSGGTHYPSKHSGGGGTRVAESC